MGRFAFDRTGLAICLSLAASSAAVSSVSAFDISSIERAAGVWEISRDGGARKCAIQLRTEKSDTGNALGMPATCRHAMPALANASTWRLASATKLDLLNRSGVAILSFTADKGGLVAAGAAGEAYVLMTANDVAQNAPRPGSAKSATGVPPVGSAPPARPGEIPGRYSVLRDGTKDTGCMLTLETSARGAGSRAQLAPACRDNGFVVFDPQSWNYAGGRLRLTARKGHTATFERGADGSWQKDPKEGGKPLGFRKM